MIEAGYGKNEEERPTALNQSGSRTVSELEDAKPP